MAGFNNRNLEFILNNRQLFDSLSFRDSFLSDNVAQIAREKLASVTSATNSTLFEATKAANHSAVQMIETARPRTELAAQLEQISKGWGSQLQLIRETLPGATIDMALKSHLSRITDLSILAQSALANLPPERIGAALPIHDDYRAALRNSFLDYSNAYRDLFRSLEQSQTDILSLRPSLTELPAFGYYTGANLVRSISAGAPATEDEEEISEELAASTSGALEDRLRVLNPGFVQMLEGARQALDSGNSDYVRQFSISLSELVTQVLKHLVPDEKVRAWSGAAEYYDESGAPTSKARLECLSKKTGWKQLTTYAKKSFEFDLELLTYLQHGSNEAGVDYTPEQLRDLITKVENTLLLITEIADSEDEQEADQQTSPGETSPSEQTEREVETVHVLFMDVVGYSKLKTDQQPQILNKLRDVVRSTVEYQRAREGDQVIPLPTGDGMALVFSSSPEAAAKCALEVARALQNHPEIELRMGIHTGPVYRILDISDRENVSGGGINFAQRVMDCGDAGHILVSKQAADVLGDLSAWENRLHELGDAEVKHGVRLHLYNLYTDELGNSAVPFKLQKAANESRAVENAG
jgi:class 3 adenylate cyclase